MRHLRRNPKLRPSPHGKNLAGKDLSSQNLSGMNLSGADLSYARLEGADLQGASLRRANLTGANLTGAKLMRANFTGADLSGANLTGARFSGARLHDAKLSGANFSGASLAGAYLSDVDFHGADLTGADLLMADLTGANFTGADLTGVKGMPRTKPLREHYEINAPTSPAFKKWFGESVVVGDDKKPVVVYHGTDAGGFTVFDPSKLDEHHNAFYFTDDLAVADTYVGVGVKDSETSPDPTADSGKKSGIYRLYIRLVNPMIVECQGSEWYDLHDPRAPELKKTYELAKWAQEHGHDGVIFKDIRDDGGKSSDSAPPATVYAVFDPKAIKSATANNGNFDPSDPDIRHNPRRPRRR